MEKLKKYLNWQIILIIFVNLFIVNFKPIGLYMLAFIAIFGAFRPPTNLNFVIYLISVLIFISLSMIRFLVLPMLYTYMEKHSKNELVQRFIKALKTSRKFRIEIMIIPIIFFMIEMLIKDFPEQGELLSFLSGLPVAFLFDLILFSLTTSYLVLFLWWKYKGELK